MSKICEIRQIVCKMSTYAQINFFLLLSNNPRWAKCIAICEKNLSDKTDVDY